MVMKRTLRVLAVATALWLSLGAGAAAAALQAYVDRTQIAADESFTLTLQSDDSLAGSPDTAPLDADFEVLGQSRSTSLQIVNGTTSRTTQWNITLLARHAGRLQIPPLTIGSAHSPALTVEVGRASQPQASAPGGDLFLEAEAEPHSLYVQQQLLYTVRLFTAANLANGATLSEPEPPTGSAVVEKLGDDKHYQTYRDGRRYSVVERRYAIYPQKSGPLTIPALQFEGDIVTGGGGFFAFDPFQQRTRHKRLSTQPVTLTVQPAPAAFTGPQWLPARSLQLVEQWSPEHPTFTVGQPVTRTLVVMADGLADAQLPTLGGATVDGLKQYPDQPDLKETKDDNGITGVRSEKIAYIPTRPGHITLPAVTVPWWNTVTDRLEVAQLPERTIDVAPAPAGSTPAPVAALAPTPAAATPVATPVPVPTNPPTAAGWWPWVALTLALGWLATLLAWGWSRRRTATVPAPEPVAEPLRRIEQRLKAACFGGDAAAAAAALLDWSQRRWTSSPPRSLLALARRATPPLAEQLTALDRALYAPTPGGWQGQALWQQFCRDKPENETKAKENTDDLRPLYQE